MASFTHCLPDSTHTFTHPVIEAHAVLPLRPTNSKNNKGEDCQSRLVYPKAIVPVRVCMCVCQGRNWGGCTSMCLCRERETAEGSCIAPFLVLYKLNCFPPLYLMCIWLFSVYSACMYPPTPSRPCAPCAC